MRAFATVNSEINDTLALVCKDACSWPRLPRVIANCSWQCPPEINHWWLSPVFTGYRTDFELIQDHGESQTSPFSTPWLSLIRSEWLLPLDWWHEEPQTDCCHRLHIVATKCCHWPVHLLNDRHHRLTQSERKPCYMLDWASYITELFGLHLPGL